MATPSPRKRSAPKPKLKSSKPKPKSKQDRAPAARDRRPSDRRAAGRGPAERDRRFDNRDRREAPPSRPETDSEEDTDSIYGKHAVLSALQGRRQLNRIWVTARVRYNPTFHAAIDAAKSKGCVVDEVEIQRLNQLFPGVSHQGIAAQVAPYDYLELDDLIDRAFASSPQPIVLVADSITDPHNLGAMIRTGEALGAHGLVIPQRRAVGITSSVMKVAAGALEHFAIARVVNLSRALETLKEREFWIYGTVGSAPRSLHDARFDRPVALAIGAEDKGLGMLAQKHCDELVSIPLVGKTESLNASVAAAIALYEVCRQRYVPPVRLDRPRSVETET